MESLIIERTKSTPLIHFDVNSGHMKIEGESYPENVAKFYTPVLNWIEEYIEKESKDMILEFNITYFNSSTSKVFMMTLDMLENGFAKGRRIEVKWMCDRDNEVAIECGEEFKEDLELLPFTIEMY